VSEALADPTEPAGPVTGLVSVGSAMMDDVVGTDATQPMQGRGPELELLADLVGVGDTNRAGGA
jgi:hypothetical protein